MESLENKKPFEAATAGATDSFAAANATAASDGGANAAGTARVEPQPTPAPTPAAPREQQPMHYGPVFCVIS